MDVAKGKEVQTMAIKFRNLEASDVECRVATVSEKGVSLLLYKDARCDMRLLDETCGPENWECEFKEIAGSLYCGVTIYCDGVPRTKWNNGTESNTEAEKGRASDAFKRACFMWGIGRELYTAPFIWIPARLCNIKAGKNGRPACYDRFAVSDMVVSDSKRITSLEICDAKTGRGVYVFGPQRASQGFTPADGEGGECSDEQLSEFLATVSRFAEVKGVTSEEVVTKVNERLAKLPALGYRDGQRYTKEQCATAHRWVSAWLKAVES